MKLDEGFIPSNKPDLHPKSGKIDLWVMSRLYEFIETVNSSFHILNFSKATSACHNFWLYDLCDNYLEMIKPVLSPEGNVDNKEATKQTLYTCLDFALRLLHPFMPFVTEELYQRLPRRPGDVHPSIMVTSYPIPSSYPSWANPKVEEEMKLALEVVKSIRTILSNYNVAPSKRPTVFVHIKTPEMFDTLREYSDVIKTLGYAGSIELLQNSPSNEACAVNVVNMSCDVYVDIRDMIDVNVEISRLESKCSSLENQKETLLKKMNNPSYSKVPENIRNDNSQKLSSLEQEILSTKTAIENFSKLRK